MIDSPACKWDLWELKLTNGITPNMIVLITTDMYLYCLTDMYPNIRIIRDHIHVLLSRVSRNLAAFIPLKSKLSMGSIGIEIDKPP